MLFLLSTSQNHAALNDTLCFLYPGLAKHSAWMKSMNTVSGRLKPFFCIEVLSTLSISGRHSFKAMIQPAETPYA